MEFNGINLLLILFAPVALIFVIVLLIYPLQSRLFDREKPLKKEIKDKGTEVKKEVKQKLNDLKETAAEQGIPPTQEQLEEFRGELKALRKEYTDFMWDKEKEIIKVHNEESGFSDTVKELKVDVGNGGFFYIASMLLTLVGLPILIGLRASFLPRSAGTSTLYVLFILPAAGCWLGYKGYVAQQKKPALILCLSINIIYAIFIAYGILNLG